MLNNLLDDLRFPIGVLFLVFSLILVPLGLSSPASEDGLNLNLWSGLMMGVFALVMLAGAILSARRAGR